MKTTLKVAELASFLYALLCFGSFCINAVYYSVFGIDITAYMTLSEILLLFLAQPILYVPIIVSVILMSLFSNNWGTPASIHRVYDSIALRNDWVTIFNTVCLFALVKVWYDIPLNSVFMYTAVFALLFNAFIPGYYNGMILWVGGYVQRIRDSKNKYSVSTTIQSFKRIGPVNSLPQKTWLFLKKLPSKIFIHNQNKKKRNQRLRGGWYRTFISHYRFSPSEVNRLRWIYNNPFLFYFIYLYIFAIVIMSSANYSLAVELKKGTIISNKTVSFESKSQNNSDIEKSSILIGESNKYIFKYNMEDDCSIVFDRTEITNLIFRVRYPSIDILKLRFGKGLREIKNLESNYTSEQEVEATLNQLGHESMIKSDSTIVDQNISNN